MTFRSTLVRSVITCAEILACVYICILALTLFAEWHWVSDMLSQFRVQWFLLGSPLVVFLLCARRWRWAGVLSIAYVLNAVPFLAYLLPTHSAVDHGKDFSKLRIISLNVLTSNQQKNKVSSWLKSQNADFISLLEVDLSWRNHLEEELGDLYPHRYFIVREDNFGVAFLSKFPWQNMIEGEDENTFVPFLDIVFDSTSIAQLASTRPLRVSLVHPVPPMRAVATQARDEMLASIVSRIDSQQHTILIGDFNCTPWSPKFNRLLLQNDLRDSALGTGLNPTWRLGPTWLLGLKLDHALISDEIDVIDFQNGADVGSDHLPIILDFSL